MQRQRLVFLIVYGAALSGLACVRQSPATLATQPSTPGTSVRLDASALGLARHYLARPDSSDVTITVQGPDMPSPIATTTTLSDQGGVQGATLKNIPSGPLRIVTVQYLSNKQPVPGGVVRGYGALDDTNAVITLSNSSTVEAGALLALMATNPDAVAKLKPEDVQYWMELTTANLHLPDERFLNTTALLDTLAHVSTNNFPSADPSWALVPGYVAVGLKHVPPGMQVSVSVNDAVSDPALSVYGDGVLVGPILPQSSPYVLTIAAKATSGEQIGTDLISTAPVTVTGGQTATPAPFDMAKSIVGAPLLVRTGGGGYVALENGDDQLWLVGGGQVADGDPTSAVPPSPLVPNSTTAFKYERSGGWSIGPALAANFPVAGEACAAAGTVIYSFGGYINGQPASTLLSFDTAAAPAAPLSSHMSIGGKGVFLSEAVAGTLNGKIYVACGSTSSGPNTDMVIFDPVAGSCSLGVGPAVPDEGATGGPHNGMAGAVVNNKWYVFGGYDAGQDINMPVADTQIFDPATNAWTFGKSMPTARDGACCAVVNNQIWVIGGEERRNQPTGAVEVYDPSTDSWTRRAPLRTPRSGAGAAPVKATDGSARIVVAGGIAGNSPNGLGEPVPKDRVEELVP